MMNSETESVTVVYRGTDLDKVRQDAISGGAVRVESCDGLAERDLLVKRWAKVQEYLKCGPMTDASFLEKSEAPDLRGPAVVLSGSLIGGFACYGPFETIDAAVQWIESQVIWLPASVMLVKPVKDRGV